MIIRKPGTGRVRPAAGQQQRSKASGPAAAEGLSLAQGAPLTNSD